MSNEDFYLYENKELFSKKKRLNKTKQKKKPAMRRERENKIYKSIFMLMSEVGK